MNKTIERAMTHHSLRRRLYIFLIILCLGMLDYVTGYEFSFSVFYLLPVSLAAWYDNKRTSSLVIVVSAMTWLWADFISGHHYSNAIIPFWNACVRLAFFAIVAYLLRRMRYNLRDMTVLAMQDGLTGLKNARAFHIEYQTLYKLSQRHPMPFALAMIDLDGFKSVNDRLGHQTGDVVLKRFANVLNSCSRDVDLVARLGGDEFALLMMDINADGAAAFDMRLREHFIQSRLKEEFGIDFSMGIQLFDQLPTQLEDATHAADQWMYQSKQNGKSQTTIVAVGA